MNGDTFAIPAAIYRSAECFLSNFGHLPRSAPKECCLAFFGAQKLLKKHSVVHFQQVSGPGPAALLSMAAGIASDTFTIKSTKRMF